jgi:hypothetical protein
MVAWPDISDAESLQLKGLFTQYRDIFAAKSDNYRWTDKVYHCKDMGEA